MAGKGGGNQNKNCPVTLRGGAVGGGDWPLGDGLVPGPKTCVVRRE